MGDQYCLRNFCFKMAHESKGSGQNNWQIFAIIGYTKQSYIIYTMLYYTSTIQIM